ncbi:MAG: 16S rRNA (cytosine(967)-C(5))-methyltransferase RsmB [Rhodoferax sp.]|nr:16S rRNA (cytosine(967)-C(5))-methyltransferase RsmB [Rhodoferax sp.]
MNNPAPLVPLWRQLQATAQVIQAVNQGMSGTAAIDQVPHELRPAVQALAFHVWRNLGRARALRRLLASEAPPPAADALLCVAVALAWQDTDAPYEVFTLVNQAVEAAKRGQSTRNQAAFVNGCLRRFLRERDALVAATDTDLQARWNHPLWWIQRLQKEYPDDWQHMLEAANAQAPMALRVNLRKNSYADYVHALAAAGIAARAGIQGSILLDRAVAVQMLPGFASGDVSVQDTAAQMAAPLLLQGHPLGAGRHILDACAAPGGKTGHLLELSDAAVTALDVDAQRCTRISQNLNRLGLSAQVVCADASQPDSWWDGQAFDAILLDAPCTASGIVRRHPDVRWLRRETDIDQLAQVQRRMLKVLWALLKPGGRMVYCTCSVFRAEGDDQIQTFLAHNTDALLLPSPGHLMPQNGANARDVRDNQTRDHDGFYYALLEKRMA